jgi:hypothetical protein
MTYHHLNPPATLPTNTPMHLVRASRQSWRKSSLEILYQIVEKDYEDDDKFDQLRGAVLDLIAIMRMREDL